MDDIKNQTRTFLGQFIGTHRVADDDADIFASGLVTSLLAMQLIAWVESTFALSVEDQDLARTNFNSVGAIARFVLRKRGAVAVKE